MTSRSLVSTGVKCRSAETSHKDSASLRLFSHPCRAKLVCRAGPAARAEFMLEGDGEWVVGRAAENAISISDTSVSRRHLALRRWSGKWLARDLSSGNGTIVNGRRITAEKRLRDGDILLLGDTELELVDPTEPRTLIEERASLIGSALRLSTRRKHLLLVALSAVGLLLVLLGGNEWKKSESDRRHVHEEATQRTRQRLEESFQRGKNLVREGNWNAAKAKFEEVERADSNFPDLQEYLGRINKEIPNHEQLVKAEAALSHNELGAAAEALAKVSKDTMQHAKVEAIRGALEQKIKVRLVEARSAFVAEDYETVNKLAEDILRAAPDSLEAEQLINAAQNASASHVESEAVAPLPRRGPWRLAIDLFLDGDLPGGILILDQCAAKRIGKCKSLATRMRDFQELQKRVDYLDGEGLKRLIALDRQINQGKESWWSDKAKLRLGAILYKLAANAETGHDWGRAARMAGEALQMDPKNAFAANLLQDLKSKAKDVYLSAYTIRDSEPEAALAKFREVLQMTSPGEEDYQKAKSWVEKLSK